MSSGCSLIRIFTDGACKGNGRVGAKASYAVWFPENREWSVAKCVPDTELQTNQRGELKAIYEGVHIAYEKCGSPKDSDIQIYTDSMYSKDCLTKWVVGWMSKKWKTNGGSDVKHRDLIEPITLLLPKFKSYTITYVKAHTGNRDDMSINNDIVDKMAVNVLVDTVEQKQVSTTEGPLAGLPLTMMGPPLEESKIIEWCKSHLEMLDPNALKNGLFSAFKKTIEKNGYDIEIQRLNKTRVIRLIAENQLVKEGLTIIKEE
jgi:ribonuclease HI